MRTKLILTAIIISFSFILFSQETQPNYVLKNPLSGYNTYEYVARDFVSMIEGYSYSPKYNNYLQAKTDPLMVFPPEEGEIGGPNTDDDGIVGAIPGAISVSVNGAATYAIPIGTPPGIGGMTPEISLVYNSSGGDGILGPGWAIAGLSAISNVRPTQYYSDVYSSTEGSYFNTNNFILDGQRLIRQDNDPNYQKSEYRLENDDFSRIMQKQWGEEGELGGIYFTSETKSGLKYEYGKSNDSRQWVETEFFMPHRSVLTYNVNKITDRFGNHIYFEYLRNTQTGESYISKIKYGNGGEIVFEYDDRNDPIITRVQHHGLPVSFKVAKILTSITTKYNGTVYRTYSVDYKERGTNEISCLNKVTLEAVNGVKYNKTVFDWSEIYSTNCDFDTISGEFPDLIDAGGEPIPGDFNGDGLIDICVKVTSENVNKNDVVIYENTGNNTFKRIGFIDGHVNHYNKELFVGDFNGDGISDLLIGLREDMENRYIADLYIFKSDFSCSEAFRVFDTPDPSFQLSVGDFDGDGLCDVLQPTLGCLFGSSDPEGDPLVYKPGLLLSLYFDQSFIFADFNGNGRMDALKISRGDEDHKLYINKRAVFAGPIYIKQADISIDSDDKVRLGDFNGDFIADLCIIKDNSSFSIYQGFGAGFIRTLNNKHFDIDNGDWSLQEFKYFTGDFNGDGRSDILRNHSFMKNWKMTSIDNLFVSNNSGTDLTEIGIVDYGSTPTDFGTSLVSDFNSDGISDIFCNVEISLFKNSISNTMKSYQFSFSSKYRLLYLDEQYNCINYVTNGLGVKTKIEYKHLTGETRKAGIEPKFPIAYCPGPITVVDIVKNDDNELTSWVQYEYEGARIHVGGKGFLGYLKSSTTQYLNYGFNIISETNNIINKDFLYMWPETISKSLYSVYSGSKIILSSTENIYDNIVFYDASNNIRKNIFPFLKKSLSKQFESDGSFVKVSLTNNNYNEWGDLTSCHIMSDDDPELDINSAEASFDFRLINTNIYKAVDDKDLEMWILGRLETAYVKKESPDNEDINLTSTFDYYDNGLLKWEKTQPWGNKWQKKEYFYYQNGNLAKSETTGADIEKSIYQTQYDKNNRFIEKSINPLGHSDAKTHDELTGDMLFKTDPNGLKIEMKYNGFGGLLETINPNGTKSISVLRWVMPGDKDAPKETVSLYYSWSQSSGGPESKIYYDKYGRELRSVSVGFNNNKVYVDTKYDILRNTVQSITKPYFKGSDPSENLVISYTYDKLNRQEELIEPGDRITSIKYEGLSQSSTNPAGQTNVKTHNAAGWLVSTTDANNKQNTYSYYSDGKLKKIKDSKGNITTLEYDIYGNRTKLDDPDLGISTSEYFVDGSLKKVNKANGKTSTYTYDIVGRMKTRTEFEGFTEWFYDDAENALGKISHIQGPGVSERYFYDKLSRLIQKDELIEDELFTISNSYDIYGRGKTFTYPSGYEIINHYNENSYLKSIEDIKTGKILWEAKEMNASGQLKEFELGNDLSTSYDYYEETGLIKEIETSGIQRMAYEWYNIANLKRRENQLISGLSEDFKYDNINRLTEVFLNGISKQEMRYDELGNITYKSDVGVYLYEGIKPHAVSSIEGSEMPISNLDQNISYTSFDKVEHIDEGESVLDIVYGILHDRKYMRQVNGDLPEKIKYYVGGGIFEKVIEGDSEKLVHYLSAGAGLFAIYTESIENQKSDSSLNNKESLQQKEYVFVLNDHLGSIQYLTDESGVLIEENSFDAWGKRRDPVTWQDFKVAPIIHIDRGFTGHEHLDLFELVNMNGRIYDPVIGRFLSADPFMQMPEHTQGLNRYSYCFNNPLSYTDPSGFSAYEASFASFAALFVGTILTVATAGMAAPAAAVLIGFVAGFTGGAVNAVMNGASFGQAMFAGLQGGVMGAAMAGVSCGIGQAFSSMLLTTKEGVLVANLKNIKLSIAQAGVHGIVNGGLRLIQGGRFEHGFMAGFFSSLSGSGVGMIKTAPMGLYAIVGAATGGTAEALGGGKFANGAVTGAFVGMFNHGMHANQSTGEPTESEGGYMISEKEAFNFAKKAADNSQKEVAVYTELNTDTGEIEYFVNPWKENTKGNSSNIWQDKNGVAYHYKTNNKILSQDHFAPEIKGRYTIGSHNDWITSINMKIYVTHHDVNTHAMTIYNATNSNGVKISIKKR